MIILLHIANAEPVKVDVDEIPAPDAVWVIGKNPRQRNDKEFDWVDEGVNVVLFPLHRINFIQVLPGAEKEFAEIELPFRE
jgi:hypothetical protein